MFCSFKNKNGEVGNGVLLGYVNSSVKLKISDKGFKRKIF